MTTQELLTDQFYRWEVRGRGGIQWDRPVDLEPPFRPFFGHYLAPVEIEDDGIQETPFRLFVGKMRRIFGGQTGTELEDSGVGGELEPDLTLVNEDRDLVELQVQLPADLNPSTEVFEQFLYAIPTVNSSIAFELIGDKEELIFQLVVDRSDLNRVSSQFKAHFPEVVLQPVDGFLPGKWNAIREEHREFVEFGLLNEFVVPLNSRRQLAADPLASFCGALDHLAPGELGVIQVLFQPVQFPWAASAWRAVTTEDGSAFFKNAPEITTQAKQKLGKPLFAVVIRLAARADSRQRVDELTGGLCGPMNLFGHPTLNEFLVLPDGHCIQEVKERDLLQRASRRSGMLLNGEELVGLVHLPSSDVRARRLKREAKRTKEAPGVALDGGVILGTNLHEGSTVEVALQPVQRLRHMHVIGASGTGKSTLLLNMICQDMQQGHGIGVLDPHGDLIDQVLARVPSEREQDIVLFDPSDEDFPIGFNVLKARSSIEKTQLASDLVAVFRRLSTSWGDQMNSVLGNAVLAFLESARGGTLMELRRFLLEPAFRKEFLTTVQDPDIVYYWQRAFPILKSNSVGPLLTRLDTFLRPKSIRYIVGQHDDRLDFAHFMNGSKLFLAKLPRGLVGKENAFLLGALLVAKFHQVALARQELEASQRRPFFLYVDEFQEFATPSMAEILSGARKFGLGLILAHHELRQLHGSEDLDSAVMSHPYTRACFRLGDADAKKIAEGFSLFGAVDLQNLDTGEAICRMERADQDFNLQTNLPSELNAEGAKGLQARLKGLSQHRYGTPRAEVEQELARSRADIGLDSKDPFASRTQQAKEEANKAGKYRAAGKSPDEASPPKTEATKGKADPKRESAKHKAAIYEPAPIDSAQGIQAKKASSSSHEPMPVREEPAASHMEFTGGRGGPEHTTIQRRIAKMARNWNFEAETEYQILEGRGIIDVSIRSRASRDWIACQICMTTQFGDEIANARKCFAAGCELVVLICKDESKRNGFEEILARRPLGADGGRVLLLMEPAFYEFLQEMGMKASAQLKNETIHEGIPVSREFGSETDDAEERRRRAAVARKIAEEARKRRRKSDLND